MPSSLPMHQRTGSYVNLMALRLILQRGVTGGWHDRRTFAGDSILLNSNSFCRSLVAHLFRCTRPSLITLSYEHYRVATYTRTENRSELLLFCADLRWSTFAFSSDGNLHPHRECLWKIIADI